MAKGFVIGIQFEVLFKENLYFELADHANDMASKLVEVFVDNNYPFYVPPCTNQLFPILPDDLIDELSKEFLFSIQKKIDKDHSAVRFVTSWATTPKSIEAFREYLESLN